MTLDDVATLDWAKGGGLLPAVVQHARTGQVLMLAWMNEASLRLTLETRRGTFYSRSRQSLWVKGETSGHTLEVVDVSTDCDSDAILVLADPAGPACHNGTTSCFDAAARPDASAFSFLAGLERIVAARTNAPAAESYTARLLAEGTPRIAQKVGEEGVETALAAAIGDRDGLRNEAADLLFHLLVLLRGADLGLADVVAELARRHRSN